MTEVQEPKENGPKISHDEVPSTVDWKKDLKDAVVSKKGLYVTLLVLGLFFGRLGLNTLLFGKHKAPIPTVKIVLPKVQSIDDSLTLPGNMEGIEQASLYAHVGGYLKKLYADEGDKVKKDQLLAVIDAPDVVDAYNREKADLNLKKVTRDRYQELVKENVISEQEFDTIDAAYNEAKAKYDAAAAMMAFTQIRAPFDGSIARRFKYPGDLISITKNGDQQPIFIIINESVLRTVVNVPQIDMSRIKVGSEVDIKVDSFPDQPFKGKVSRIDELLDEATKTQRVLVDIDNPEDKLHAGIFASVVLHFDHKDNALTLPADSIESPEENPFVYTFHDGVVKRQPVTLGIREGDKVEVVSGLSQGDEVIARGMISLADGMKVNALMPKVQPAQEQQKAINEAPPNPAPAAQPAKPTDENSKSEPALNGNTSGAQAVETAATVESK